MKVLGIDTTGKETVAVLLNDGKFFYEIAPTKMHSENLFPVIEYLLVKNKVELADIDLFAVVTGPGSFTGIRIGLAVIKTFAYVFGRKVIAVSSLELLAHAAGENMQEILCLMNAGAGKAYRQCFKYGSAADEPGVREIDSIKTLQQAVCLKEDAAVFGNLKVKQAEITPQVYEKIICRKLKEEAFVALNEVSPLYLRESQAEVNLKKGDGK